MITKYFEEILGQKTVPEVTDNRYKMFDDGGVEAELGDFLYGLVRVVKPKNVLETGLYSGISASYMAKGLQDNGEGHLISIEFEAMHVERAKSRLLKLNLLPYVTVEHTSSLTFNPQNTFQIILLDTEPNIRFQELVRYFPYLDEGGFMFIHDLPRNMCQGNFNTDHPEIKSWPFGDIPSEMKKLFDEKKLIRFHLPSPRGMVGLYKPRKDDYGY